MGDLHGAENRENFLVDAFRRGGDFVDRVEQRWDNAPGWVRALGHVALWTAGAAATVVGITGAVIESAHGNLPATFGFATLAALGLGTLGAYAHAAYSPR